MIEIVDLIEADAFDGIFLVFKISEVYIAESTRATKFSFGMDVIAGCIVQNLDFGFVVGKLKLKGYDFVEFGVMYC